MSASAGRSTVRANGDGPRLNLRIADVPVIVRSGRQALLQELSVLYPVAPPAAPTEPVIRIDVREHRVGLGRRRYRIYGDGEAIGGELRRDAVMPFLEWGINLRIIATRGEYVQLHAATMGRHGHGFIFAGASGCGKSTLAAGLLARGWDYLCDEFALVHPRTLCLHPLPKPLCIKAGSYRVLRRLGLPFARRCDQIKHRKGRVGYINPRDVGGCATETPVPVRYVIFPHYAPNQPPRLHPITRARALIDLAGCVFNRHAHRDQALPVLVNALRHAECYRLETGDLEATCALLESQLLNVRTSLAPRQTSTDGSSVPAPVPQPVPRRVPQRVPHSSRSEGWGTEARDPRPAAVRPLPSRRDFVRRGVKLSYVVPTVLTLSSQAAFAAGSNPSGVTSGCVQTSGLCETDSDCCSADCQFGVCQ